MGMSSDETKAYQELLNAVMGAMRDTKPEYLKAELYNDLAMEYMDFSSKVAEAAQKLVAVIIAEHPNPDTELSSAVSHDPVMPYFF